MFANSQRLPMVAIRPTLVSTDATQPLAQQRIANVMVVALLDPITVTVVEPVDTTAINPLPFMALLALALVAQGISVLAEVPVRCLARQVRPTAQAYART